LLHERIDVPEFVVIVHHVGLDGCIFQKLVTRVLIILLLQIGQAQVEMNESQFGICLGGSLEVGESHVVLLEVKMGFAHE